MAVLRDNGTGKPSARSRSLRIAVVGTILAVAACFGVAISLAGVPAAAEQAQQIR
ncbi:hypothetical protein GRI58_11965 [Porphyrobacter algicida]|uniref:Uncharacterized protein n=1 Tax=Qipengyuania algicida TaxID=1836209 RepID=A0A845AL02_9SPHN|nr:hypothetical protein [Qipengyuania algicida]MXP29535.1 hypothetical protein [Qipengyuania algicida]